MKNGLLIGCHQGLSKKNLDYIHQTIQKFLKLIRFMKIVILCGGLGSRLSEETRLKTKTNGKNWKYANFNAYC